MMLSQTSSSSNSNHRSSWKVTFHTTNLLHYCITSSVIAATLFVFVIVTTNTITTTTITNIRTTSAFRSSSSSSTSVPAWIIRSTATSTRHTGSGNLARYRDYGTKRSHSSLQFRRGGVPFVTSIPLQNTGRISYDHKQISNTPSTGTRLFSSILSNPEGIMEAAPIAYRDEENGFVYAGVGPEGWDVEIPRQDEKSKEPMMDPPIQIPDPYHWMRDDTRTDPKVLDLLKLENEYTNAITKHLTQPTSSSSSSSSPGTDEVDGATGSSIVTTLYNEMLSVLQESDYTTPRPNQNYLYYKRTIEGKAYTIYCRSEITAEQQMLWTTTTTDTTTTMTNEQRQTTPIYNNEQILLDVNVLGINQSYCAIGTTQISPSQKYYAYTIDYTGDEICTLMIIDITDPNQQHVTVHENTVDTFPISGSIEWGNNDTTMYYLKLDTAQRPYQVYHRTFQWDDNSNQPIFSKFTDTLIYEDLNDAHWVGIYKSQDDQYLFIESSSKETTEIHFIRLQQQNPIQLHCIAQRRSKVLYEVDHRNGLWWITSNVQYSMDQPNMALYTSPAIPNCESSWTLVTTSSSNDSNNNNNNNNQQVLFDGNIQCSIDGVSCFQNHVVVYGREDGLSQIWILGQINDPNDDMDLTNITSPTIVQQFERLTFEEEAFDVGLGTHYEYNTNKLLVMYESMITPTQSIEIDMTNTQIRTIVKEKNVPQYDKTLYNCERRMVPSRDGTTQIPISMVYRKDVMEQHQISKQPVPVHLYGYGSYGACMECDFVATRLPLLQRNMIYVVAHVRGGGEMGRHWYEEPNGGKYLCKKNTFYDFCDVAQWLISTEQLTTNQLLSCEGRSAGGLLIGASINLSPELFKVAILGVPFVDVVPTMIDASIPLTAGEWEEWGNPNEMKFHQYMMEYSPTFNVKMDATYPACLLTGGLHDPRVQYWEPMKFVAALRYGSANYKHPSEGPNGICGSAPICLKIDMSAGHFSASDRYKYYKEKAFDYAFLLDQLGLV